MTTIRRSLGVRFTFWYLLAFVACSVLIYILTYFLLSDSLRETNRRLAVARMEEYTRIERSRGLDALFRELKAQQAANQYAGFFIRVLDSDGRTLFETIPPGWNEQDTELITEATFSESKQWVVVRPDSGGGGIEIKTYDLSNNYRLQVSFGPEDQERMLETFKRTFFIFLAPVVGLGVLGGLIFSRRAFRPVRDLLATIRAIDPGNLSARVPSRGQANELDELVLRFNAMLERIETLVLGMRSSLDNVAHDLRTPLARMRASVETAIRPGAEPGDLRPALEDCVEESQRMADMLTTLMDISEAEAGAMRLERFETSVKDVLDNVADLYEYVAEDKNVAFTATAPENLTAKIDAPRMLQAVANLVDNALKYTPGGGSVSLTAEARDGRTVIEVRDTGPGIEESDLPHIFDRLYRGDKSRSERGLGLGLSLVKAVVEAHGGEIRAGNLPEGGAVFVITL